MWIVHKYTPHWLVHDHYVQHTEHKNEGREKTYAHLRFWYVLHSITFNVYQLYQLYTGQDINFISSYVYYDIFICVKYRHSSVHVTRDCVDKILFFLEMTT
jgi:hypothetical protein